MDLAAGADGGEAFDALIAHRVDQGERRREAGFVSGGRQDLPRGARQDGLCLEVCPGCRGGGDDGVHLVLLEQTRAQRRDYAGPLGVGVGASHPRGKHGAIDPEAAFFAALAGATVQTLLDPAGLVAHEGAGLRH